MNLRGDLPVQAFARTVGALLGLLLVGCVDINGGAVELSWSVRSSEGEPLGCQAANLADGTVQLECDTLVGDPCELPRRLPEWACEDEAGATRFEIPPGTYLFSIAVRCSDGTPADVRVPDPIRRDVLDGDVVQLNSLLIEVPEAGACA